MFNFLFLLSFSGCMTNKKMIEKARNEIGGVDCLIKLEKKFLENHCTSLDIHRERYYFLVRCKKTNKERKNFWDSWWFRISSIGLEIHPDYLANIEEHTICTDARFRIEAYPE